MGTREIVYAKNTKILLNEGVSPKIFVTGFHGVGHVGWIATRHIVTKLEAKRVGMVLTPNMTPFVSIKNGVVTPYELYAKDNLLAFLPNVPVSPKDSIIVPQMLAQMIFDMHVDMVILFGGLDASFAEPDSRPRIAPTSSFLSNYAEIINKHGLPIIDERLGIVGPLATLLTYFEAGNIPAVAILPYASLDRPDPRAAAQAVEIFSNITGIGIDVKELLEEGEQLEKQLEELEKKIKDTMKNRESLVYHV
ncbi:hypothetical protein N186_02805 [Thermofilum adornatum]|jgi:uncharacterized protein|uniref:Proteasome assembly chaperone family protein n=2 Tax=Thermofilum adornatum TaxID=1365176 RepID=S5Z6I9_9CREN|nr:PAC2 family protein [Thermofilum adornatum]AGT34940.1 hypothetical protein N186_02805 [Thermofilum adornatum]AJB42669.1 hypothetical protein TCARB_1629 [Thermofilum adornatum 1505]